MVQPGIQVSPHSLHHTESSGLRLSVWPLTRSESKAEGLNTMLEQEVCYLLPPKEIISVKGREKLTRRRKLQN